MKKHKWLKHRSPTEIEKQILATFTKHLADIAIEHAASKKEASVYRAEYLSEAFRRTKKDLSKIMKVNKE